MSPTARGAYRIYFSIFISPTASAEGVWSLNNYSGLARAGGLRPDSRRLEPDGKRRIPDLFLNLH
jgi:hypothetical protein